MQFCLAEWVFEFNLAQRKYIVVAHCNRGLLYEENIKPSMNS